MASPERRFRGRGTCLSRDLASRMPLLQRLSSKAALEKPTTGPHTPALRRVSVRAPQSRHHQLRSTPLPLQPWIIHSRAAMFQHPELRWATLQVWGASLASITTTPDLVPLGTTRLAFNAN